MSIDLSFSNPIISFKIFNPKNKFKPSRSKPRYLTNHIFFLLFVLQTLFISLLSFFLFSSTNIRCLQS